MRSARIAVLGTAVIAALMVLPSGGVAGHGSGWAHFASPASPRSGSATPAAYYGVVTILPSGVVTPAVNPLSQSGNLYTLTSSFAGSIVDDRNGSTINGANYVLTTQPGTSYGITIHVASNVTIEGIVITNCTSSSIEITSSSNVLVTSVTANGTGNSVDADQVDGLTITGNHFNGTGELFAGYGNNLVVRSNDLSHTRYGIYVYQWSGVTIQSNNLSFGTGAEVFVEYSNNVVLTGNTLYNLPTYANPQVYCDYVDHAVVTWNNGSAGSYGVELYSGANAWITNNRFPATTYSAFYVEYETNLTLRNNIASRAGSYGVYGYSFTNFDISSNLMDHAGSEAAYLEYGTNGIVSHNNLSLFNAYGLDLEYSANVTVTANQMSFTTTTTGYGLYTYEDSNTVLTGNNATYDEYGWYDGYSDGIVASNDNFGRSLATGYAVYLEDDGSITISNTLASYSYYGLYAYYVQGLSVTGSSFDHAGYTGVYAYEVTSAVFANDGANVSASYGLELSYSTQVSFTDFWATPSTGYGALAVNNQAVSFTGCNFDRSGYGFFSEYNAGLVLSSSNLSQGNVALYLYDTVGAAISGNTFWSDNTSVNYQSGNSGALYHNNFLGDRGWTIFVAPTASFRWDNGYPSGGNYWSNYTGVDVKSGPGQNLSGSDRVGDTPFVLDWANMDRYPLMGAWTAATITFTETGLSTGTRWSASVNGQAISSTSNTIVFAQGDGATATFSYAVGAVPGYHLLSPGGGGFETGTNLAIVVIFTPVNYTVSFSASGVSATTSWSVTVNGHATTGSGPSITVPEPNGSYSYTVGAVPGYTVTPMAGMFTVSGSAVTVTLTVTPLLFNVTFTESGLGSGMSWSVTLNGNTQSSTGSTIVFQEPVGTYSYTVGSVSGYSATPSSGQASVSAGAVSVGIAYSSSSVLSGTSGALLAGLIVFVILALLGWVMYFRARKPKQPGPMTPAETAGVPPVSAPTAGGAPPASPPTPPPSG